MITVDKNSGSANIALWYRDIPIQPEDIRALDSDITKECRKYLIGKMCLNGKNKRDDNELVFDVYNRLGQGFGYASFKNLVAYARAIDRIQKILPDTAMDILDGKIHIALKDTITIAKMKPNEIDNIVQRIALENGKTPTAVIISEQKELREKPEKQGRPRKNKPDPPQTSVKDIPHYDPDAQVNALVYTIPSWVSAIDRAFSGTDFSALSSAPRNRLTEELLKLRAAADVIIELITEETS